ncbi:class I SAM-dependent methyltransferase [Vitiosangium sp. GDMCC 1.1324]|uniref:class I SAM-dependent methyltransferase n=1 Tax=Vitiosangium sp. (strain GDMCC 1.1324) TaxID=2138576 RepID=UPI000D3783E0|nr:class I SAM-dependent methyltransferase [Vitiosangium sp. GDMCC 1.1324]PTL75571.1 class I SAM-dependent methyltransferase [Vitiosangium sp. GDMCC 1.1324]
MSAPITSADFDRAYRAPITFWGDIRIPKEIQALARQGSPRSSLELGCGVGRFTRYLAQQGLRATGVDFSPVAIAKARARVAQDDVRPEFIVGDVTHLDALSGPYDVSFDVGCFHCFDPQGQRAYVSEVSRLLKPGGIHLIWALDWTPSDMTLSPASMKEIFAPGFELQDATKSRRRLVRSHWYWLVRSPSRG